MDCAHCAKRIEDGIKKIDGVISAKVNFLSQKLIIEAYDADFERVFKEALAVCKSVEPDCTVIAK